MLWTRWYISALVVKVIGCINIVRIGIVCDGMNRIDVNPTCRIDDFNEAIQSNPRIIVDGNSKVFFYRCDTKASCIRERCRADMLVSPTERKGCIKLTCTIIRDNDAQISWDREHTDVMCLWVDRNYNICLCEWSCILAVVVAAKEQDVDAFRAYSVARCGNLIRALAIIADMRSLLTCYFCQRGRKVGLIIPESTPDSYK